MSAIQALLTEHIAIWTAADTAKKSGRGRSSGNAASVYGIKKLRELIFELAALGRLVNEDIHQPAKLMQFGEIAEFVMGQAPPGSECNTNGIGTIFVKTGEFGSLYPEVCEWTTKPLKFAKKGDVLICVVGATVGKLNLAIDCAIGRSVAAIRPVAQLDTKYIYFALIPFTLRLRAQSRGSAQGVIGKAELNAVQIRLPSIAEQHRIVAKVDELMALCDQLETRHNNALEAHEKLVSHLLATLTQSQSAEDFEDNWQRIAAHFDTLFTSEASIEALKQTLLQLAVMGKLVPQDPNDEPASALLKRIQAEKAKLIAESKIKKDKPLAPIAEEEKPFDLPQGWEFVRLAAIISMSSGDGLTSENMNKTGIIPVFGGNGVTGYHTQFNAEEQTLVIGRVGFYCGSIHLTPSHAWITDNALRVKFSKENIAINFLYWLLTATNLKENESATAQPLVTGRKIYPIVIGLPPLAEQHRIVAKVDELMALCDRLKTRITEANQLQQKLAGVMVERAIA